MCITTNSIRVKTIEIRSGDAVDQIKFTYDDGSVWSVGQDGGKPDKRIGVMTKGEFIVRVTHERLLNFKCAAAAVEFETNKGRIFSYQPPGLTTKKKTEQITIQADEGKEIISLRISKGELVGCQQQVVPQSEIQPRPHQWYAIIYCAMKEDEDEPTCRHFDSFDSASDHWRGVSRDCEAKIGRAALLVDCIRMVELRSVGPRGGVEQCLAFAQSGGFYLPPADAQVSVLRTVGMLVKLLSNRRDVINFAAVMLLLVLSSYMDITSSMLSGQVLTLANIGADGSDEHDRPTWLVQCVRVWLFKDDPSVRSRQRALIVSFVASKVLDSLLNVLNIYVHHRACDAKNHELQIKAFNHVMGLDQSFFDVTPMGEVQAAMNASCLNDLITWNIPYLLTLSLKLLMVFCFMIAINVPLTIFTFVAFAATKVLLMDPIQDRERMAHKVQRKMNMLTGQVLSEALGQVSLIKLLSKEQQHMREHEEVHRRYMQTIDLGVSLRCAREFGFGVMKVATFSTVLYHTLDMVNVSSLAPASLTSFFLLFQEAQELVGRIKWHQTKLITDFGRIEAFLGLMEKTPRVGDGDDEVPEDALAGAIEFRDVTFDYPGRPNEHVFTRLNLTIQPHRVTAIVGDSGAGKSSLAKLLMRVYDPKEGAVLMGGHDIRRFRVKSLHDSIGIVTQSPELFDRSIRDNIAYGAAGDRATATDDEVVAAAKLAKCFDFVSSFQSGFDTYAGALGSQLSGGQKQRIAIARAAVRDPKILVLDEATSALDAENEAAVQGALEGLMRGRTTVVIAHRLSTIRGADDIVCLGGGRVLERGTHEELMSLRGTYFNLVSKQLHM